MFPIAQWQRHLAFTFRKITMNSQGGQVLKYSKVFQGCLIARPNRSQFSIKSSGLKFRLRNCSRCKSMVKSFNRATNVAWRIRGGPYTALVPDLWYLVNRNHNASKYSHLLARCLCAINLAFGSLQLFRALLLKNSQLRQTCVAVRQPEHFDSYA
jgi:hypothetical protein